MTVESAIIMGPPEAAHGETASAWHAILSAAWPAICRELLEEAGRCGADPSELVGCYIDDSMCEVPKIEGLSIIARDLMPMMLRDLGQMLPGFDPAVVLRILAPPPPIGRVYVFAIIDRRPGVHVKDLSAPPPASA